jgi:hypothetical protein
VPECSAFDFLRGHHFSFLSFYESINVQRFRFPQDSQDSFSKNNQYLEEVKNKAGTLVETSDIPSATSRRAKGRGKK